MEGFLTLSGSGEFELVERRSRFVALAVPVGGREQAEAFVAEIKQNNRDASHNVWAYLIDPGCMRASDDGEPSGTAGAPALEVLKKEELRGAAVVITRYFGGVLLGAGGLVRAYAAAARGAVSAAGIVKMALCSAFSVEVSYGDDGRVLYFLRDFGAVVTGSEYGDTVHFSFYVTSERAAGLLSGLAELTSGKAKVVSDGERFYPVGQAL